MAELFGNVVNTATLDLAVILAPDSSTRNTVTPDGNYPALSLVPSGGQTNPILQAFQEDGTTSVFTVSPTAGITIGNTGITSSSATTKNITLPDITGTALVMPTTTVVANELLLSNGTAGGVRRLALSGGSAYNLVGISGSGDDHEYYEITGSGIISADYSSGAIDFSVTPGSITFDYLQSVNTNTLVGRYASGVGQVQQITLGSAFSFSGSTLNVTASAIDHGGLGGLSDDDHSQYIINTPLTALRNVITGAEDTTALTVKTGAVGSGDVGTGSAGFIVAKSDGTNFFLAGVSSTDSAYVQCKTGLWITTADGIYFSDSPNATIAGGTAYWTKNNLALLNGSVATTIATSGETTAKTITLPNLTGTALVAASTTTTANRLIKSTTIAGGVQDQALGTANQVLGMNDEATDHEYKTITAGTGISITHAANSITITNTGSSADPGGYTYIIKSADQDVTNATSQNDSEFFFPVAAGKTYRVEMELTLSGNDTAGDYGFDFAVDAGTFKGYGTVQGTSTGLGIGNLLISNTGAANTGLIGQGTPADITMPIAVNIHYSFTPTHTTTFRFRFGNNSASAGRTSRTWQGSIMRYKQLN